MVAEGAHQSGDVLDNRYRLVDRLGRGGFGDVWRADELLPDGAPLRQVALKLLHPHVSTAQDWGEEARIIASLRHPALVTIYAAGLLELETPRPFVAMELLLGDTLAEWVNRGERVPWRRVLSWARDAAAALDEIHRAGVVHLDLKPANLFLAEGGELKVLDFGIARQGRGRSPASVRALRPATGAAGGELPTAELSVDDMSTAEFVVAQQDREPVTPTGTATVTRSVVGTPGFMAPEVLEDAEATRSADAYALAACIVQLATGRLPQQVAERPAPGESQTLVQGWFAEVQAATVRGRIRDLSADEARLPSALVDLLQRWLALDPVARGLERGTLRTQLDEVWSRPHGLQENPYRGLASYGSEDEGRLYGREDDISRIARDLAHQPCVVLHGTEGIGLRSVALAGVIPQLAKQFVDDRDDWLPCIVEIDDDPDGALDGALERFWQQASGATDSPPRSRPDDGQGSRPPRGVRLAERLWEWTRRSGTGVVVVITELQRVLQAPAARREVLLEWLASLGSHDLWPGVRLLATLREEHTSELLALEEVGAALRPWLRFMGPPPATIAADIVRRPALAANVPIGDVEVVEEELQRELREQGVRLPLVSLALRRWWDGRDETGLLSGETWTAQGGMLGAVAAHADGVLDAMSDLGQQKAEAVLLRLVASDGSAVSASYSDLVRAAGGDAELAERTIETLLGERLVVQRLDRVRLVHPRLAQAWKRLHELRLHDMDRLAFLEELREIARRWADNGRPKDLLWRGEKLRELGRRFAALDPDLGTSEYEFIHSSRRGATRRRALIVAQVVAVGLALGVFYWVSGVLERRAEQQERARAEAERREAISRMVTQSRRTADPYIRVAMLAGAMQVGSDDPVLPLELFTSARGLPRATFLSLQPVPRPNFPWDSRWLLGGGSGAVATVFDFEPVKDTQWGPVVHRFRPHQQGMDDLVAFPFDSSFVTRGLDGVLKVWRLRLSGEISLAAVSPMKCRGGLNAVVVAARAPVVACATAAGLARWDLRRVTEFDAVDFQGRLLHLSPDGGWIAASRVSRLLFWHPTTQRRHELDVETPPTIARFSPRDAVVAVVRPDRLPPSEAASAPALPHPLQLFALHGKAPRQVLKTLTIGSPASARWDPGGLDLLVCNAAGSGSWHYLRSGGRAPGDEPPVASDWACSPPAPSRPKSLGRLRDYGGLLAGGKRLGPRLYSGGWQLDEDRLLTRDLVLFQPAGRDAERLLEFVGRDAAGQPELSGQADSTVWVGRDGEDRVVWQVGKEIRQYKLDGERLSSRKGNVLRRCSDERLLAWRRRSEDSWELFTARHGVHLLDLPREPGFFLGADASCATVFLQRVNGELVSLDLTEKGRAAPRLAPLPAGGGLTRGGYVYDVRPSAGSDDRSRPIPAGLWLAFSSGAMARLEGPEGTLRLYGHATPRPSVMADGPQPGQLVFADRTGVVLRQRHSAKDRTLVGTSGSGTWTDIHVRRDGATALLADAHRVAVLDLERGEIVGELSTPNRGRLVPWDDEGSVLVWSYGFLGSAVGEILPIGPSLSQQVAQKVSNLSARLGDDLLVRLDARR